MEDGDIIDSDTDEDEAEAEYRADTNSLWQLTFNWELMVTILQCMQGILWQILAADIYMYM